LKRNKSVVGAAQPFSALRLGLRGPPPRHAKRASGTPGLRRKEWIYSCALRHDSAASIPLRQAQGHLRQNAKVVPWHLSRRGCGVFCYEKNQISCGEWRGNPPSNKSGEGWVRCPRLGMRQMALLGLAGLCICICGDSEKRGQKESHANQRGERKPSGAESFMYW